MDSKAKYKVIVATHFVPEPNDQEFELIDNKEYSIGSNGDIDCVGDLVQSVHGYIRVVGDDIWYTDNYTIYGSFVMSPPGKCNPLMTGEFCLGNTLFDLKEERNKGIYTLISKGEEDQLRAEINTADTKEFFIGRDRIAKVQVMDDETISSQHAQLTFDSSNSTWNIRDHGRTGKGSSNGTWIKLGVDTIIVGPEQIMRIGKDCFIILKKLNC